MPVSRPIEERFWEKVDKGGGPAACWVWTAVRRRDGYGQIIESGKVRLAHRVAWELQVGEIPDGLHVLHHCDNPPCVNRAHLWLGTHADNMRDMSEKGRVVVKQKKGADHSCAKLTWDDVREIRRLVASGVPQKLLAEKYGMARSSLCKMVHGETYGD